MATRAKIVPRRNYQRGLDVSRTDDGGFGLSMTWKVDTKDQATDFDPDDGYLIRSVVYMNADQRRALAGELLEGL